jgi:D-alanyl-D-alanine carboxypeptidase
VLHRASFILVAALLATGAVTAAPGPVQAVDPTDTPTPLPSATATPQPTPDPDITKPVISGRAPAINAVGVAVGTSIRVTFSEPVLGIDSANFLLRNSASTATIPAVASYNAATRVATLDPNANLAYNTRYLLVLSNVGDQAGNALGRQAWRFTTQYRVSFAAGAHTGYKFSSTGVITSRKAINLTVASSATATYRTFISGRGVFLRLTSGALKGFLVPENARTHQRGMVGLVKYSRLRTLAFPVGRYTGYLFNSGYTAVTATRVASVPAPSTATASRYAVISGRPHVLMASGTWASRWVRSTSGGAVTRDNAPLPSCAVGDVLTRYRGYGDYSRTLLDPRFMIPRTYVPTHLVKVTNAGVRTGSYGMSYVRSLVIPDLKALNAAARAAGYGSLIVNSGYRSYDTQARWFASYSSANGYKQALLYSNRAGHSGHQLGTTLDINVYAATGLNAWMRNNAYKYGFIQSYPANQTAKHCYGTEDWHYRYLGRDTAANIFKSGLTEREWLWLVHN